MRKNPFSEQREQILAEAIRRLPPNCDWWMPQI